MKLGKLLRTIDSRTLWLENYLNVPALPPLPETADNFAKVSRFNMGGNDQYGDCVVAGAAHMIQTWSANAAREAIIPDKTIINTYLKLTGGADTGLNMLEFLKFWRNTGIAGHKIGAFASVNPKNLTTMRYANWLFGGIYLGIMLPVSAQKQQVWDVVSLSGDGAPGSWGGHCVNNGLSTPRIFKVGTWGMEQTATANFMATYCDEAYAILSLEFFDKNHKTPAGFDWKTLLADLKAVTA